MTGKIAVITGSYAGIGLTTTRALLATGMKLYLTARDVAKAQAISELDDSEQIEIVETDQNSFTSIRAAAREILRTNKGDILINNAGIMAIPTLELTADGHEKQFQTNHLSHFLLFILLKPTHLNASSPSFASPVVNVSAAAHLIQGINKTDNYNWQSGGYKPWDAYAQSKIANI